MADWDADGPQLERNLVEVAHRLRDSARRRDIPTVEAARRWHVEMMQGLDVPQPEYVGKFRGEEGLEDYEVEIGLHPGIASRELADVLARFESKLQEVVGLLDAAIPPSARPSRELFSDIVDVCAWAHAEWVRIHPFANGNGRTARLWANSIAMRYGLPPFVRVRPRPDGGYAAAGEAAMRGNWKPTAAVFGRLLREATEEPDGSE